MNRFLISLSLFAAALFTAGGVHAEEIAMLFTGRTHAMLYPCNCPIEPAGGISRRATAIRNFAAGKIPFLLVDCGDAFAGGPMDQYARGTELDQARTQVNFRAMAAMGYDCASVGDSEVSFGGEFFATTAAASKVPFACCNVKAGYVRPLFIKKTGSTAIGFTSIASEAALKKMTGATPVPAEKALRDTVEQARAQGCGLMVVASNVSEKESYKLVRDVPGVDILILNKPSDKEKEAEAPGNVIVLKSFWQGRRLGKTLVTLSDKVEKVQFSEETLNDKVPDDKPMAAILPKCFSDSNCLRSGQVGTCAKPGTMAAQCVFAPAPKVRLLVITAKECVTCDTESTIKSLRGRIPGLSVETVPYPGKAAGEYMRKFGIHALPAYLLGQEIEKEKAFEGMKATLEKGEGLYRVKPEVTGFGFFPERPRIKDRIDLFLSPYGKDTAKLLENMKEFSPVVHFLVKQDDGAFSVRNGSKELEEDLRSVCVGKYYPGLYYGYLSCRSRDPESSWWDKCLEGVDTVCVRECALGNEGARLLGENIALNKELGVENGPTYLYENREIFSSVNVPSKEELRKILVRD